MKMKVTSKKGVVAAKGFQAAAVGAGIRKKGRKDMMLLVSDKPAIAAGLFTVNQFAAAPVQLAREVLKSSSSHYAVLINSGSANACTGKKGYQDALALEIYTAKVLGCKPEQILMASTGVIGERLPVEKMKQALPVLSNSLQGGSGLEAAEAIMTTDTVVKMAEITIKINGQKVTIGGMAKGSGMIHPDMATMLAVITTDINLTKNELNSYLKQAARGTFNAISIDGENSTNDTVFLLANGAAGKQSKPKTVAEKNLFNKALTAVLDNLAEKIVLDGEGATKLINIVVKGAKDEKEAVLGARAIVDSQLVKTAIYGEDANWGRILQSLGATAIKLDPTGIKVIINNVVLVKNGIDAGVSYSKGNQALKKKIIDIIVELGVGQSQAKYRTCDLTKGYIDINAGYRS